MESNKNFINIPNFTTQDSFTSLLDLARWIAAFIVFIGHLRSPIFCIYTEVEQKTLLVKIFYFVTDLGVEAVMIFFVLSGFLVGGKNLARATSGSFNFYNYCIDRISRLYVVLLPALVICFFLDVIGSTYFIEAGLYNHEHDIIRNNFPEHVIAEHLNSGLLIANFFMLQSFYTETVGSNFPLWSLSFEFWFYLVFGLLLLAGSKQGQLIGKFGCIVLALVIIILLGYKFVLYFLIWGIGLSVVFFNRSIIKSPIVALIFFVASLIISRLKLIDITYLHHLLVALTFGIFLLSMKGVNNSFLCKTKKINSTLAGFSYSLYLLHFPLILFLLSVWVTVFQISNFTSGYQPSSTAIVIYLVTMVVTLILSYGFARVTEHNTAVVRQFLKRNLRLMAEKLQQVRANWQTGN
ncbi:hypothetical protein PN36_08950 [Candidatus Thiomargarita nelsonii]|uniref:Acyltransferase 3 domain-containing protein n=1 Tax=Candidatus Thiomargarita nelsonii TaxID=1003181 RepID=A0A0A6P5N5_9GAMM|nr:hypothetical protein PN36_08950 [Candidatus Thiomargarita nelsonii]